jgi:hypothetical protein
MKGKKKTQASDFGEQYIVTLSYKKPDGFWVQSHQENIVVSLKPDQSIKCSHSKAEQIARKRYPGCKIINVLYC